MKNKIAKISIACLVLIFINGCVSETYAPFQEDCTSPGLTFTKSISQIYAIAINPSGTPANSPTYTDNDIIEGYVVSSDEGGNFYQSIYVEPIDKSKGFNISVDIKSAYLRKFQPGKKVYLKLKGLGYANPTNFASGLIFGAPPTDKYAVDRLDNYKNNLIPSCDVVNEDLLVNNITLAQVSDTYLNTLVEIKDVQFDDLTAGGTYDFDLTNIYDDNTKITDGISSAVLAVRTSRFANFAGFKTPTNNGTIRGVLTKYSGSYQIVLRTERDVKMTNPRVVNPSNPVGGTDLVFGSSFSEPFTSYSTSPFTTVFPKYINDQTVGNKYWSVKVYNSNNYLEMTSYTAPTVPLAKSYFMVPVDFTNANSFTFKKEARYNKGPVLKVYYVKSSDFNNGFLNVYSFIDITSSFNITYPAVGASQNSFDSAGTYNIDQNLTGNGFFVFEYTGTNTITTTMQIDDITIN